MSETERVVVVPDFLFQILVREADRNSVALGYTPTGPRFFERHRLRYGGPDGFIYVESEEQPCEACKGRGVVERKAP
jgi:hypothetical protein